MTDKIYARKPTQPTSIRRNEVKSKVLAGNILSAVNGGGRPLYISNREEITQRAAIFLRGVKYMVEAHSEMTPKAIPGGNEGKFRDIIMRRLHKSECYRGPYFRCREFPAQFALYEEDKIDTVYAGTKRDLGYMLFGFDYSDIEDIKPMFLRAVMKDGVLDVGNREVMR